eukprot:789697-Prymnesium_polylepis.1
MAAAMFPPDSPDGCRRAGTGVCPPRRGPGAGRERSSTYPHMAPMTYRTFGPRARAEADCVTATMCATATCQQASTHMAGQHHRPPA